jgi:hypothetical protein
MRNSAVCALFRIYSALYTVFCLMFNLVIYGLL